MEKYVEKYKTEVRFQIIKDLILYFLVIVFALLVAPKYMYARTLVDGHSMEATLHNKDMLIQEKVSYYFVNPARYDVVVFQSPVNAKEKWVKRVIGLPGETIQIIDGSIYINGKKLSNEVYGNGKIDYYGVAEEPFTIPDGQYFVMGDNRSGTSSWDSRYSEVGTIKKDAIEGHIVCRISPFNKMGLIK